MISLMMFGKAFSRNKRGGVAVEYCVAAGLLMCMLLVLGRVAAHSEADAMSAGWVQGLSAAADR